MVRNLSIGKAIVLMMSPTIVFAVLYLCYRLLWGGIPASLDSNVDMISGYIIQVLYVLFFFYGIRKYSFSFHLEREKLKTHNFLIVFLLSLSLIFITPLLRNLNLFFIKDISSLTINVPLKNDTAIQMADYILGTIVLAPIIEELFYKNIFDKLRKNYSSLLSIFCVSFFFTLPHLTPANWHAFFSYFIFSMISCIVFLKTESIVMCVFFHFLFNFFLRITIPYHNFLYENIYTQTWYIFIIILSAFAIYELLQRLRK